MFTEDSSGTAKINSPHSRISKIKTIGKLRGRHKRQNSQPNETTTKHPMENTEPSRTATPQITRMTRQVIPEMRETTGAICHVPEMGENTRAARLAVPRNTQALSNGAHYAATNNAAVNNNLFQHVNWLLQEQQ